MTALHARALSLWHYLRKVASHDPALFTASLLIGIVNGLLEGVGLFLLVPLLAFLGLGEDAGEGTSIARYFQDALNMLGLPATLETVIALFLILILATGRVGTRLGHVFPPLVVELRKAGEFLVEVVVLQRRFLNRDFLGIVLQGRVFCQFLLDEFAQFQGGRLEDLQTLLHLRREFLLLRKGLGLLEAEFRHE